LAVAAAIAVVGLCLTVTSTWASMRVDRNSEHRLLQVQTNQVATVLSTTIALIQQPLATAVSILRPAGRADDTTSFTRLMSAFVGKDRLFESASLWQRRGRTLTRLAHVGAEPAMPPGRAATRAHLRQAFDARTFTVESVTVGGRTSIVYAQADPTTGLVVYADRAIPADRRSRSDQNSAFVGLHYAIYLGPKTDRGALSTTDVAPSALPLTGNTARATVPFGDTVVTLVTSPRHHLGATLSQRLPMMLLLGGLFLTVVASAAGHQLTRGRLTVEEMYGQQRELSERLQRALLPRVHPVIPNVEIAAEYVAAGPGVEIGGDWYSIVGLGGDRFGFVVGDVSGRGIDAVAVMARARFTISAYLLDGHSPAAALERCSHQFDIDVDGHMTTALVGIGDWRTGVLTLANAGHPTPLLVSAEGADFVTTLPGRPLGTGPGSYQSADVSMTPGTTLLCFTDGLVERRTEDIDTGMRRLATTARRATRASVADLVRHAVHTLRHDDAGDDVAVLAVRWVGAS
jgi:hypothetical protein